MFGLGSISFAQSRFINGPAEGPGAARAQLLYLVWQRLPMIVAAYSEANSDAYSRRALETIRKTFPSLDGGQDWRDYQVVFSRDLDGGTFQVDGVTPDRLAINTGYEIYFNLAALIKKNDLTLDQAVQLWLHEILHQDKDTPLDIKDAWTARVAQFVKDHSSRFELGPGRWIHTFWRKGWATMPEYFGQGNMSTSLENIFAEVLDQELIAIEENASAARRYSELYQSIRTFGHSIHGDGRNTWQTSGVLVPVPQIAIQSLRVDANANLVMDYQQRLVTYQSDYRGVLSKYRFSHPINADIPEASFRINLNSQTGDLDIRRVYGVAQNEMFFEIDRVQDVGVRRFVSLRVKSPGVASRFAPLSPAFLVARDLDGKKPLSFLLKQRKLVSRDEVQFHLEIPQSRIELSQILIPAGEDSERYEELQIRPARPQTLLGKETTPAVTRVVRSMTVKEAQRKGDPVRLDIAVSQTEKIVGVTLDIEHLVSANSVSVNNLPMPPERIQDVVSLRQGRKYFVPAHQIQIGKEHLSLELPQFNFSQFRGGVVYQQGQWGGDYRPQFRTMYDTRRRKVIAAWIHLADGNVVRVSGQNLPEEFSMESREEIREREKAAIEQAKKYLRYYDHSLTDEVPSCESLFLTK